MTADIINLRRARKAKARAERTRQADENRVVFGRTKAERTQSAAVRRLEETRHAATRREGTPLSDKETPPGDETP